MKSLLPIRIFLKGTSTGYKCKPLKSLKFSETGDIISMSANISSYLLAKCLRFVMNFGNFLS